MPRDRRGDPFYLGVDVDYIYDEMELGKRATTYLGNEAEGWGPWIDPKILEINMNPVVLHRDWIADPETGRDPYKGHSVTGYKQEKPDRPLFIPGQRRPAYDQAAATRR